MVRSLVCWSLVMLAAPIHLSCTSSSTDASETPTKVASVVQFDETHNDRPVATFKFEQFEDGRVTLKIENILNPEDWESVSFTYKIAFTPREVSDTAVPWENQGAVTNLAAGQTANQSVIATSMVPLDEGRLTIEFTSDPDYEEAS